MRLSNIFNLGIKEFRSLLRDPVMIVLIFYAFSVGIYSGATALSDTLNNAPIAIIDEDRSTVSGRITDAFYRPYFTPPVLIDQAEMDSRMDAGLDTFALNIPPDFQSDLLAGHQPTVQLNVDATRMTQAFSGSAYVQAIVNDEVRSFLWRSRNVPELPVDIVVRARFNPEFNSVWFGAIMEIINNVTMLSIILTGAALIREREHGTIEHLLVMPVTPFEIMTSKVWSMSAVVLVAVTLSLTFMVQGLLSVPIEGSIILFLIASGLHLFATTSMGIFLGTLARSMPQFGLLIMLVLLPLMMLSGGVTPRESMPQFVQYVMMATPNIHYVELSQAILYRGAGLDVVWPQFLAIALIGSVIFALALARFRKTIGSMV